jgi:hypothetical protein
MRIIPYIDQCVYGSRQISTLNKAIYFIGTIAQGIPQNLPVSYTQNM